MAKDRRVRWKTLGQVSLGHWRYWRMHVDASLSGQVVERRYLRGALEWTDLRGDGEGAKLDGVFCQRHRVAVEIAVRSACMYEGT